MLFAKLYQIVDDFFQGKERVYIDTCYTSTNKCHLHPEEILNCFPSFVIFQENYILDIQDCAYGCIRCSKCDFWILFSYLSRESGLETKTLW